MEGTNMLVCPVCTLYLRPGITLENHLHSHPKQKVIEALIKATQTVVKDGAPEQSPATFATSSAASVESSCWSAQSPHPPQSPANHSFIYQQFMSSSGTQPLINMGPMAHQFVAIPAVFNPQMFCPPYIFQQQQQVQIVSAATNVPFVPRNPSDLFAANNGSGGSSATTPVSAGVSNPNTGTGNMCTSITDLTPLRVDGTEPEPQDTSSSSSSSSKPVEKGVDNMVILNTYNEPNGLASNVFASDESDSTHCSKIEQAPSPLPDVKFNDESPDLHKACQTDVAKSSERKMEPDSELEVEPSNVQDEQEEADVEAETEPATDPLDGARPASTKCVSTEVLVHNNNVTILEMMDINLILPTELLQNGASIISKVDESECMSEEGSGEGRGAVLLRLGEVTKCETEEPRLHESVNIRADERMPPRGELSEQESNGASEPGWAGATKLFGEGAGMSYDLLARETWDASDCSDGELTPPLQSRVPPAVQYNPEADVDEVLVVERESPPLRFACSTCGVAFRCPKERRVHQASAHSLQSDTNTEIETKHSTDVKVEIKAETEDSKEHFLCYTCGELLVSQRDLNVHNRRAHKSASGGHMCRTCGLAFPSEARFTDHLKEHPLECQVCGKHFYRLANLRLHQKRHMGVRPHKCDVCAKGFLTKQKLAEHHNVHTGNAPIKCTMCDETFRRYSNLVQHRNRYHLNVKKKVKDYVCACGEVFHSKNKFNWHKEIHEPKPKSCRYCHEKFVHMASLTRHIRRAHNQRYVPEKRRESENVECRVCHGVYLKSSLEAHMATHSGKKQHACNICSKEFSTKWNLKLHKWTHATATSKPFKCELCQSAFVRHSDLVAHSNSHKSVRPYTCNYCGCKFIRKYNCLRHVREHEESKAYTCSVCNKSFHRSYYLKEHMRVHNGVRPFACNICGKTSTTKSNHNKHMKIHHAREPVSTEG